jgi:hypothetical protein
MVEARLWSVTVLTFNVGLAAAVAIARITNGRSIERADRIAVAHLTADNAQLVVIGRAAIALFAHNTRLAATSTVRITLHALRAVLVALTIDAAIFVLASIKAHLALFTIRPARVALAVVTITAMAR